MLLSLLKQYIVSLGMGWHSKLLNLNLNISNCYWHELTSDKMTSIPTGSMILKEPLAIHLGILVYPEDATGHARKGLEVVLYFYLCFCLC